MNRTKKKKKEHSTDTTKIEEWTFNDDFGCDCNICKNFKFRNSQADMREMRTYRQKVKKKK